MTPVRQSTPDPPADTASSAQPARRARRLRPTWLAPALAAGLLAAQWLLAWSAARTTCTTYDEVYHLTAGYTYWRLHDYRLHPENGVLAQRWAALPLLFANPRLPALDSPAWRRSDVEEVSREFFYGLGNDPDRMLALGRAMVAVATAILGTVVFLWSRRLCGDVGSLISVTLFACCPTVLANGALATSDLMVSLTFLVALATTWRLLHRVSVGTVVAAGVATGLLLAAKMSGALLLPVTGLLLAARLGVGRPLRAGRRRIRGRGRQASALAPALVAQALIALLVVWSLFGFRYATSPSSAPPPASLAGGRTVDAMARTVGGTAGAAVRWAHDCRLLPEAYLHGFAFVLSHTSGRVCFLNGAYSTSGWRCFFPYCLAAKTPLPSLGVLAVALLAAAVAAAASRRRPAAAPAAATRDRRPRWWRMAYRALPLVVFLAVYWTTAVMSHLNIGHRHLLPTYPVLYILAGGAGYWFTALSAAGRLLARATVVLLLGLSVESALFWPHYLAYVNALAGGPHRAYRHLVDSSLDWGQDLPGLRAWMEKERGRDPRARFYVSYFGTGNLDHEGIAAIRLPCFGGAEPRDVRPLTGGAYCISATMLQGVYSAAQSRGAVRALLYAPWGPTHERLYRQLAARVEPAWRAAAGDGRSPTAVPPAPGQEDEWRDYEQLRFARLRTYLLGREPDESVGYSILIYRLTDAEVREALGAAAAAGPAAVAAPASP